MLRRSDCGFQRERDNGDTDSHRGSFPRRNAKPFKKKQKVREPIEGDEESKL